MLQGNINTFFPVLSDNSFMELLEYKRADEPNPQYSEVSIYASSEILMSFSGKSFSVFSIAAFLICSKLYPFSSKDLSTGLLKRILFISSSV